MCMKITKAQAVIHTATEDITVYKVAFIDNGRYLSCFEQYEYDTEAEMTAKWFNVTESIIGRIQNGETISATDEYRRVPLYYGFHSFVSIEEARDLRAFVQYRGSNYKILKFVIPKNTKYIEGTFDGDYLNLLSEKLRFVEEVAE